MNYVYPEYPFSSHFLSLGKHRLHYIDQGSGSPVVMLHGNPTWSYYFRNLITHLQSDFRVVVPDHLGCGLSDKPIDYSYLLDNHIKNIEKLIDHLGLRSCSLVVHDWGGAIGLGYCVRHIKQVDRIVIMNSGAFRSAHIPRRIALCRIPLLGELIIRGANGFAWPASFMAVKNALSTEIVKAYLAPYNSWRNRIGVYRFVQDIPMSSNHPSYDTLLEIEKNLFLVAERKIPMEILWGGSDFCFDDSFYVEWKRRFPHASSHYFPEAGHYVLEDERAKVLQHVEAFLKGN